jgi:hypothetical protein
LTPIYYRHASKDMESANEYFNMDDNNDDDDEDDKEEILKPGGNEEFEEDIVMLRNYSFIAVNMDLTTFEMHGLVQLAMRKWLDAHGQLERWKQQYVTNLYAEFSTTGEYVNWTKCQAFFPHAKLAISQQPQHESSLREWASVLHGAAWYACERGNVADAEVMSMKAMQVRKKVLGLEHVETLASPEIEKRCLLSNEYGRRMGQREAKCHETYDNRSIT